MKIEEAEQLALTLMDQFGLLPQWRFEWDHAKRRFGRCDYRNKVISLSRHLTTLNPQQLVEDTLRHEIAHALDAEDRGKTDHSASWKRWAVTCGAKPTRCYSQAEVRTPEAPYYINCPGCSRFTPRFRRVAAGRIYTCGRCSRHYNPDYALIPNIPLTLKRELETGLRKWYELPQAKTIVRLLEKSENRSGLLKRYYALSG